MLSEPARPVETPAPIVEVAPAVEPPPADDSPFAFDGEELADPTPAAEYRPVVSYDLESSSSAYDLTAAEAAETAAVSGLMFEEKVLAPEFLPSSSGGPELEVISFNDPAYQTVFSDTATYEPPGRRGDFVVPEYTAPSYESMEPSTPAAPVAPPLTPVERPVYSPPRATVGSAFVPTPPNAAMSAKMDALFHKMAGVNASDLHLSVSMPPMVRADGKMRPLDAGADALTPDVMRDLLHSIMPAKNQEEFALRHDTDFAYEIPDLARFRCNVFMDRKGMGGVFRIIPTKILTAEQLGLSKAIMDLCSLSKGLVVVTGPTGSGKSTTLCAMVDSINKNREDHIITIEDPIEFTHENQKCLVNQREVHNHTDSFKDALRAALREDPDILLVGEMRDLETISIAIETAETGHLVFGTLHTTTAPSTVDRIIDQFPADRQQQIRVMLSESLKGVIAQTLLPKKGGGRVAALEVLIITPAISNLIREGKTFQIPSAMQTGRNLGMVMLNDALFEHVKNGIVEPRDAYVKAVDKSGFETMLTRGGFKL
jgi:twitching motility protein PilT